MSTLRRRAVSFTGLLAAAVLLLALSPIWIPLTVVVDLVGRRWRLPLTRLMVFGIGWAWLEAAGVAVAGGLWITGQRGNQRRHYALQRWWASNLIRWLRLTTGMRIEATGVDEIGPGPTIMLCRHASLADSLVSAWVITSLARMHPRYVLKRELLADPCLDLVGNRVPNYFLDRSAPDSTGELTALTKLAEGMSNRDVAVIFPEGTRSSPSKRTRAIERIAAKDPARAERMSRLQHLLPPRPSGAAALLAGCPDADVVVAWHVGFDGLDTFSGVLRHLASRPRPVEFFARRVRRGEVPTGEDFTDWLDCAWLDADAAVDRLLHPLTSSQPLGAS